MLLSSIVEGLTDARVNGSLNRDIIGLAYDSRKVSPGSLFFAYHGDRTDGNNFIAEAISRGAIAIIHDASSNEKSRDATFVRVENARTAMAEVSAEFYSNPSQDLGVVGVTGTNGKSTVCFLIAQLLDRLDIPTGLLSTTFVKTHRTYEKNTLGASTPEATDVQRVLRDMVEAGNRYGVVEATSHGLSHRNNRLGSIAFDAAVFTNLTHEHLEYHGTMEHYRNDKANLFRALAKRPDSFGVVNADSPDADFFAKATKAPVFRYGVEGSRSRQSAEAYDVYATGAIGDLTGYTFYLKSGTRLVSIRSPLAGRFNVENLTGALLTVLRLVGTDLETLAGISEHLTGVPGRLQRVDCGQPFELFIDFAHSPDAFSNIFPLFREESRGRIIAVFGSAGERDIAKRRMQGSIADRFAEIVILTDEDPRGEDRWSILREIAAGCPGRTEGENLFLIADRTEAIRKAIEIADKDDKVLLLGKSHESTITYGETERPWDEHQTAVTLLGEIGYR